MMILLSAAREDSGGLSLPAMTIIAMLLLMLPYLIKRYTGHSVTELLRLSSLIRGMESVAASARRTLFGKKDRTDSGSAAERTKKHAAKKLQPDEAARQNTLQKQRAGNIRNDYLQAISEILNFARKNRLFTIIPGNVESGGETADLAVILVTKARAVGIAAYGFDGKILCRKDAEEWQQQEAPQTRKIGCLVTETDQQERIVKRALDLHGLKAVPYETVMLFTGSDVVLAGDRPGNAFTRKTFYESFITEKDLKDGPLDPKETGRKIGTLRAGKKR